MIHMPITNKSKRDSFCLNRSKRHQKDWEVIEDLALQWNVTPTEVIFRCPRELMKLQEMNR